MTLQSGTRLGPYEILALLGAGGMGEVYRAADTRLNRIVAIKVLPAAVADHPDRRQRFEREARAVSSLTHPHICALYDVGREHDVEFLVMELVEGDTLNQRLVAGPLPLDLALRYSIQIADALDHAHRRGIIHRDLKPANIMVTRSGVKLLDFGLAKSQADSGVMTLSSLAARPTKTLTGEGTILGTLQYMAPEQLEGRSVDARTDLFAFGAVLYEMVSGQRAFEGESQASLIAAILRAEPPALHRLQPLVPAALDRLVRKCLSKDPDDRWQTARDVMSELLWIGETTTPASVTATPAGAAGARRSRKRIAWTATAILLASLATLSLVTFATWRSTTEVRPITFDVSLPEGMTLSTGTSALALSPDGQQLAFLASRAGGTTHLWVRSLESLTARELPETDGASTVFWSPDSRSLAFFSGQRLRKIDPAGGHPRILCEEDGTSGTWNSEGVILFETSAGLSQVSVSGGAVTSVTRLDKAAGETRHHDPWFLPDGRHFLYGVTSTRADHEGLYVGSLDSTSRQRLLGETSNVVYGPPGSLLFWSNGELLAQRFSARTFKVVGEPMPVADVAPGGVFRKTGVFSASATGVIAYVPAIESQLGWVDRFGTSLGSIGTPGRDTDPALSPDDSRVAVTHLDPATQTNDIWVIDAVRGGASRLTSHGGRGAVWSPDGRRVAFTSRREGRSAIYQKLASGEGEEELLLAPSTDPLFLVPGDWSRDGRLLFFFSGKSVDDARLRLLDVQALPLEGDRTPVWLKKAGPLGDRVQLSPNGRWLAYASAESGTDSDGQVYVQPFPAGDRHWQISPRGGIEPRWRRDGRELFYIAADQRMTAVSVTPDGPFQAGPPVSLFQTRAYATTRAIVGRQYVVTADGQRFLINQPEMKPAESRITVVINWPAAVRR
jgi:serine/threonine protein kinase/Tol biopolymer transport system component